MSVENKDTKEVPIKVVTGGSLETLLQDAVKHIVTLKTYKSVIPELAQVKGDSENKKDLYNENFAKLQPQIQKMRDVNTWFETTQTSLITYFTKIIDTIENKPPSEENVEEIIQCLDAVLIIDYLKTWQAGLNNDFSMYRRAIQHVKKDYNMSDDETLRFFLVNPNNIIKGLKKEVETKVKDIHKLMGYLIKKGTEKYEKSPNEQYLRVIVFCVYLMDKELANSSTVAAVKKQVKLSKTAKLFKDHPRITLYQELPFNVENFVKNCPNFNERTPKKLDSA